MKYRSEIDGLRAIAVLPVIFFHAGLEFLSGGYVGVDVFFVISGYLITSIILSEIEQGKFSLANFYERRARRILPALFVVMLVSLPFAWLWLLPSDMKDFARSLIAVPLFSSNILFWQESGYWGTANELKPMLHTWSLAVEEQYYIFFPIFLMILWKIRKRWIFSSLIVIAVISLLASNWGAYNRPTANFFMLPTRVWELAIGACIAYYFLQIKKIEKPFIISKTIDEVLGFLGLLMIIYAVFMFSPETPFPSFYTLVPTVGAGLIILFASNTTIVGKFLSTKFFVGIGLISYSVYLWHQPLLAFSRHAALSQPSVLMLSGIAALSIPLAYLSWRFIEKPFRTKGMFTRKAIFTYAIIGSAIFIAVGAIGIKTNGFENRSTTSDISFDSIHNKWRVNDGLSKACTEEFTLTAECRTSNKPEIMVWGDSYAMHLVPGIIASNPDAKVIQMTKYLCGPFFDVAPIIKPDYPLSWAEGCLDYTNKLHNWLKENDTIKYAVLSSPFNQYVSEDATILLRDGEILSPKFVFIQKQFEKTLEELVKLGIKPVIFSPPPANGYNIGRCLTKADWRGENLNQCDFKREQMSSERSLVYEFLDTFKDKYQVVHLDDYVCDDNNCRSHIGSSYIYRDEGHFSHEGSALMGKKYDFYGTITK